MTESMIRDMLTNAPDALLQDLYHELKRQIQEGDALPADATVAQRLLDEIQEDLWWRGVATTDGDA